MLAAHRFLFPRVLPTITFVASASNTSDTASIAINVPTGTAEGDLMVAFLHTTNADTVPTTPAGWTRLGTPTAGGCLVTYSKTAGAGETATTVTLSGVTHSATMTRTYRGSSSLNIQAALYSTAGAVTSCALASGSVTGDVLTLVEMWTKISGSGGISPPGAVGNVMSGTAFVSAPQLRYAGGDESMNGLTAIPSRTATASAAPTIWTAAAIVIEAA